MITKFSWDIIGHQNQLRQLEHDFSAGNMAHAYLIAGPANIGKYTAMRRFAGILQCENGFCHHCSTCLEMARGYHADTLELNDDGNSIKIETMRELLNKISMSAQSPYKIVLIKNIERMTPETANALLKTLEDPPPKVKFLFTSNNSAGLLSTILSRVRLIKFQALDDAVILSYLEKLFPNYDRHDLGLALTFAIGKPGKALDLIQDPDLFHLYQNLYETLTAIIQKNDRIEQFLFVDNLTKNEGNVDHFMVLFAAMIRKKLLECVLQKDTNGQKHWLEIFKYFQDMREMMKRNVNERLLLENLMLLV